MVYKTIRRQIECKCTSKHLKRPNIVSEFKVFYMKFFLEGYVFTNFCVRKQLIRDINQLFVRKRQKVKVFPLSV